MIKTEMKKRESAPVWAVLGAPLVGIPLLVALLALAAPDAPAPEGEPGSVVTVEQVEDAVEPADGCLRSSVPAEMRKS